MCDRTCWFYHFRAGGGGVLILLNLLKLSHIGNDMVSIGTGWRQARHGEPGARDIFLLKNLLSYISLHLGYDKA